MSDDQPSTPAQADSPFAVTPFKPENSCPFWPTTLFCTGMLVVAIGLGWLTSLVGQWVYLPVILACPFGFALAGIGYWWLRLAKISHQTVIFLLCLGAGILTMLSAHWFDYQRFQQKAPAELAEPLKLRLAYDLYTAEDQENKAAFDPRILGTSTRTSEANLVKDRLGEQLDPIRQWIKAEIAGKKKATEVLDALGTSPFAEKTTEELQALLGSWVARLGFWDFLRLKAEEGTVFRWRKIQIPVHDTVLWVCWAVECLIVGGLGWIFMGEATSAPFCSRCRLWKEAKLLGRLHLSADTAVSSLSSGALEQLAALPASHVGDTLQLVVSVCPRCGQEGPIEVRLDKVTKEATPLVHLTYPGRALPVLETLGQVQLATTQKEGKT